MTKKTTCMKTNTHIHIHTVIYILLAHFNHWCTMSIFYMVCECVCVCGNTDYKRTTIYIYSFRAKSDHHSDIYWNFYIQKKWGKLDYYFDVFEILKNKNRYFICSDVSEIMTNNKYRKKNVRKFRSNRKNKWKILWKMKTVRIFFFFLTNFMYEWMQYKNKK